MVGTERQAEVVGSEGLAVNTQAVASQISAVEKSAGQAIDSLRRELLLVLDSKQAEHTAMRLEVQLLVESVQKQIELEKDSIRRELTQAEKFAEASACDRWKSHEALHHAQERSDDAANEALEKRLTILNNDKVQIREILATTATRESLDAAIAAITRNVESEKTDTRRRFESMEAKTYELENRLGNSIRAESRPGQDLSKGVGTILAAITVLGLVIGVLIAVANYMSSQGV